MRSPGEGNEGYGGVVVDEHLPEVLSLHVKKLAATISSILCVYFYISERGGMESGIFSEAPANRETLAITPAQQLISIKIYCKLHFSMVDKHKLMFSTCLIKTLLLFFYFFKLLQLFHGKGLN